MFRDAQTFAYSHTVGVRNWESMYWQALCGTPCWCLPTQQVWTHQRGQNGNHAFARISLFKRLNHTKKGDLSASKCEKQNTPKKSYRRKLCLSNHLHMMCSLEPNSCVPLMVAIKVRYLKKKGHSSYPPTLPYPPSPWKRRGKHVSVRRDPSICGPVMMWVASLLTAGSPADSTPQPTHFAATVCTVYNRFFFLLPCSW